MPDQEYVVDCGVGTAVTRVLSPTAAADFRAQQAAQKTLDDQQQTTQNSRVNPLRIALKAFHDNPTPLPADAILALKALIALHHPDL